MIKWRPRKAEPMQTGNDQSKSKEDDLKNTLQLYKKNHRNVYIYLSETEKLIRSLRNFLASGNLASEAAFWKADSLVGVYVKLPDEQSTTLVVDFLVDVNVPDLLTEILRSLHHKNPNAFSPGTQESQTDGVEKDTKTNSEAKWALEVMYSISIAILNFTDLHNKFCEACGEAGTVTECLEILRSLKICTHDFRDNQTILECPDGKAERFSTRGSLGFEVLGVLHNLSKRMNSKKYFDSSGAVETLLSFFRTTFPTYRMTALLCLAYLVDETNNHLIMATEEPIKDILKLLGKACNSADRRSLGFSAAEIAYGLSHVATNDGNKQMIGQHGGISLLVSMLDGQDYKPEEILAAVKALYMLSFDETNKAAIKSDSNTVVLLRSLQNSDNKEIQQAASGIIWEIEGKEEHDTHCTDSEKSIMISYQWDTQETMLRVKEELEAQGIRVWMDVEQMKGSILETMARAVETSSLILVAMSRKYQNSPNCRSGPFVL